MRTLHINHPGDGDLIMARVGGVFNERTDHVVSMHQDGKLRGGVVFTSYLGGAIVLHMAGTESNWANRDFLWLVFDYVFNFLGCRMALGIVGAHNERALEVDRRLGFREVVRIEGAFYGGEDAVILSITKDQAKRWLDYTPRYVRANYKTTELA